MTDVVQTNWPTPDVTLRPHEGNVRLLRKGVLAGLDKAEADAMLGADVFKEQGKVKAWATPQVTDSTRGDQIRKPNELTDAARGGGCRNLREDVVNFQETQMNNSKIGKPQEQLEVKRLSPLWVAQLMGLPTATWCVPVDWILCDYSETE